MISKFISYFLVVDDEQMLVLFEFSAFFQIDSLLFACLIDIPAVILEFVYLIQPVYTF